MLQKINGWASYAGREISSAAVKEFFKWVALGIGATLAAVGLSLMGDLLQLDQESRSWSSVAKELWRRPKTFTWESLTSDWVRTGAVFVLMFSYAILFIIIRRGKAKLNAAKIPVFLACQAGLGGRWKHAAQGVDGSVPWEDIRADIERRDNLILYILGANGVDTFSRQGSPLHESIQKFSGTTLVLLSAPDSEETAIRAKTLTMTAGDYKKNIEMSERFLRTLKERRHSVDGRFYHDQPSWKMIITNRSAWVQYYMPNGKHVADTPIWRFDITANGEGLFHLFLQDFSRIWHVCESAPMAL